jgi:hypothetical protein
MEEVGNTEVADSFSKPTDDQSGTRTSTNPKKQMVAFAPSKVLVTQAGYRVQVTAGRLGVVTLSAFVIANCRVFRFSDRRATKAPRCQARRGKAGGRVEGKKYEGRRGHQSAPATKSSARFSPPPARLLPLWSFGCSASWGRTYYGHFHFKVLTSDLAIGQPCTPGEMAWVYCRNLASPRPVSELTRLTLSPYGIPHQNYTSAVTPLG